MHARAPRSERTGPSGENAPNPDDVEVDSMSDAIAVLRKRYDDIRELAARKMAAAEKLIDDLKDLEKDGKALAVDDDSPTTRHIRMLENRLDKALVKYNEAQSIRRTYEQIAKRLREQRIGFDNQLAAIEGSLKAKERDLKEMALMAQDATRAKDDAKAELATVDDELARERERREKDLAERRTSIRVKQELFARQDARLERRRAIKLEAMGDLPEEGENKLLAAPMATALKDAANDRALAEQQRRVRSYEEAFSKIKEATGVSGAKEVISKFMTQGETTANLHAMTKDVQARIDRLKTKKASLRTQVEEIKYSGVGGSASRRLIDEHEAELADADRAFEDVRNKYERLSRVLVDMKAGIGHLTDKLKVMKMDAPAIPLSDDTVVDVLRRAEQKLLRSLDAIAAAGEETGGDVGAAGGASATGAGSWALTAGAPGADRSEDGGMLPAHNVRVLKAEPEQSDDDDDDSGDDLTGDVPDRNFVKAAAEEKESRAVRERQKADKKAALGGATAGATRAGMA